MSKRKPKQKESKMTDITTTTKNTLATVGPTISIDPEDLMTPRILAMTGTSDLVQRGEAKPGEFRDNVNGTLLGSIDKPFEFVPLVTTKKWWVTSGPKLLRVEPYDASLPRLSEEDGMEVKRMILWEACVLLVEQIKDAEAMPHTISFKSTSEKAGLKLHNLLGVHNKMKGLTRYDVVCTLGGRMVENNKGKYIVLDVRPKREANDEEKAIASQWSETLRIEP